MDDLVDFLFVAKQEDAAFTLKGRTLATLRRRMEDWHRALRKQPVDRRRRLGRPPPARRRLRDRQASISSAIWRFRQIKTGNELFREGQRMHHCVASYKFACMQGHVSIWSLTSRIPDRPASTAA